jgi:hypothetical protein
MTIATEAGIRGTLLQPCWSRPAPWIPTRCCCTTWGGKTDWTLPDVKELTSIVDDRRYDPSIDPSAFPGTPANWFWSSSSYAYDASNAWSVFFYYGVVYYLDKSYTYDVRCVRRGP